MSDVNRTATSEQGWRRKEPTPRRKQSTQAKELTARNKNALARVTIQENKITPNRTRTKRTFLQISVSFFKTKPIFRFDRYFNISLSTTSSAPLTWFHPCSWVVSLTCNLFPNSLCICCLSYTIFLQKMCAQRLHCPWHPRYISSDTAYHRCFYIYI